MMPTPSQVEESRRRLNIPAGWVWALCAANCGDLVWHSGEEEAAAKAQGVPFRPVCSGKCAITLVERLFPCRSGCVLPAGCDWPFAPNHPCPNQSPS